MKTGLVLAALVTSATACTHFDRATLATSTIALTWDWSQTRGAAEENFSGGRREMNPVMGGHPSTGVVDAYFLGTIIVNTALWLALPTRYRSAVPAAVTLVQSRQVYANAHSGSTGVFH